MIQEIKIGVLTQDNGDGSSGTTLYPTYEAAKAAWMESNDWETEEDIPEETTYYDNGSISHDTIKLNMDEQGKITLAEEYYVEGGDQ